MRPFQLFFAALLLSCFAFAANAPNPAAYGQVGDLQARIMQAASGIFSLASQAANATSGVLSDISITVTTNNSSAPVSVVLPPSNSSADPLIIAAAQAADDARKSIAQGDYETARRFANESESLLARYAQKQKQASAGAQQPSASPASGMFFGLLAKPDVVAAIAILAVGAFVAIKYKDRLTGRKKGKHCDLDFDGL